MQKSVNLNFSNNQFMILQIHEWIKYPLEIQDRLMDFIIIMHEKDSTLKRTFKKQPFL